MDRWHMGHGRNDEMSVVIRVTYVTLGSLRYSVVVVTVKWSPGDTPRLWMC